MKKGSVLLICCLLTIVLIFGTAVALAADENPVVKAGDTHQGDLIIAGTTITHEGTITGDLLAGAQTLLVNGDVEGDVLGFASGTMDVNGNIGGNIRAGADRIYISATVDRNVMVFGNTVDIESKAIIHKNLYLVGTEIKSEGTVKGNAVVYGSNITLGGTFEGDVTINAMAEGTKLNLQQGTVIKGKLTYKGVSEYQVPSYVRVGSFEYVKSNPSEGVRTSRFTLWQVIKRVMTLLVYYLFALLIYKLFPRFFVRSGDFIGEKPMMAAGIGIATMGSLVGGVLLLIILLLITLIIFNASIFGVAGLAFIFLTVVTIVFADIPVSLWLGKTLLKNKPSVPARLAVGLALLSVTKGVLALLNKVPGVGVLAGIILFLLSAAIWVLGTGALLRILFEMGQSANRQAQADDNAAESPSVPL